MDWFRNSAPAQSSNEQDRAPLLPASLTDFWRSSQPATQDPSRSTNAESNEAFLTLSRWERFLAFLLCSAGAAACFLISFLTLPLLVIKPRKFAVAFTLGSVLFMLGFAILQGPWTHLQHLISKERLVFTITYFGSMGATLFFAIGLQSYVGTIISSVIQVVALVSYFVAYFPGGIATLRLGGRIALRGATNILPV